MSQVITVIGFAASIVNVTILLPQTAKTLKSRKTRDLSKPTMILSITSATLWVIYGIGTHSIPIILANAVTFVLMGILLAMKHRYG